MGLFSTKKEKKVASDLRDITRGLHDAATAANNLIAHQYIKLFDQFFDYDPQDLGTPMKAKMVEVALDDVHRIKVPLISLVAPKGLALDTMQVDLSVRIQSTELDDASHSLANCAMNSERFMVTLGTSGAGASERDAGEVRISLQFKACEPPEGINRLIEAYTHQINPVRQADV